MKTYKIYLLIFPNGKKYCGYTSQKLEARWANGRGYDKCPLVHKAIIKYGWDNVTKELLYEFDNQNKAYLKEKEVIAQLHLTDPNYGYNLHEGGQPTGNSNFSNPEFIAKHHEHLKELWKDPEFREKMSHRALRKTPNSPESNKKISESRKGQPAPNRLPVVQLDPNSFQVIQDFPSATHAAIAICGNKEGCSNILNACRGKRKTAYKYAWRFLDE